jgi:hypothetical protein
MRRPPINISPSERVGRIAVGAAGAIAGTLLLVSAGGAVAVVLEVALLLAGLDLVVTGALGFCPLYHRLGRAPRALGRQA